MARAIWSGSIVFGLVNIPIRLFTAVRDQRVQMHMLSQEGDCRLRRKLYCPETGKEYDFNDTARGYEIAPDQYVLITDDELDRLKPEAGRTIDITDFVDLPDVDPIYYERSYYIGPAENGAKGCALLVEALTRKNKAGIAKFVMRAKEYLVALRPRGEALVMHTMHFADEIVKAESEIDLPRKVKIDKREVAMAEQLIETLTGAFAPERYKDEYRERVLDLVERKAEGKNVTLAPSEPEAPPRTYNFMTALEQSLKEAKQTAGRGGDESPTRTTGSGRATAKSRRGGRRHPSSKRPTRSRRAATSTSARRRKSA